MVTANPTGAPPQGQRGDPIADLLLELASESERQERAAQFPAPQERVAEFPSEPAQEPEYDTSIIAEAAYDYDQMHDERAGELIAEVDREEHELRIAQMETMAAEADIGPANARAVMEEALYEESVNLLTLGKDRTPDIPIPSTEFIGTAGAHLFAVAKPTLKTRKQLTAEHKERLRRENEGLRKELKRLGLEPDLPGDDIQAPGAKTARRLSWENQRLRRQLAVGQLTKAPPSDTDNDGVVDAKDPNPGYDESVDTDGDGVPNQRDTQPLEEGSEPPSYIAPEDHDSDGIPNSEDPQPFNDPQAEVRSAEFPYWGAAQDDDDAHDSGLDLSGSPAASGDHETGAGSYKDLLKDQPGSPLDREGTFSSAPPVDLSDAPPPKLGILGTGDVKGVSSAGMSLTSGDLSRLVKQGKADRRKGRGGKEQSRR